MTTLRELLAGSEPVLAPGAYDALSARPDAALERARCDREAGADALFVEAPETEDEIEAIREDGTPAALDVPEFDAFTTMIGLPEMRELEARFTSD